MDGTHNPPLDYAAAAQRLLTALAEIARRFPSPPRPDPQKVPAPRLVLHCFDWETRRHWTHETRRRRVREVAIEARVILDRERVASQGLQLAADGQGYWLTGDAGQIAAYAARRRRHGLGSLVAASHAKTAAACVDQPPLFAPQVAPLFEPVIRSEFRH